MLSALLAVPSIVHSQDETGDPEILAQRGKGVITQSAFAARVDRIPADVRYRSLRDTGRFTDLVFSMLVNAQLAADAREAGYDKGQMMIDRMQLAASDELANAWLAHYISQQPPADYELLAGEYYQMNQQYIQTTPTIDVSHILVSSKERSDEDASALADSLYQQILQSPELFDQFVTEYSEDPSAASNHGKFKDVEKGDMVQAFELAAFALQSGEISAPVKTSYGYHIIRLDARNEPQLIEFEDVKEKLIEQQHKLHEDRTRRDYLSSLTSLDVDMTTDAMREMIIRVLGEEFIGIEVEQD